MRKLFFALVLFSSTACIAASLPIPSSPQLPNSQSGEVEKCFYEQVYIDSEDVSVFRDHIIIYKRGTLYYVTDLRQDEDGLYVYAGDMRAIEADQYSRYDSESDE